MIDKDKIREAVRCCVHEDCEKCPLQNEICDDLMVNMVNVPEELMDLVEAALVE